MQHGEVDRFIEALPRPWQQQTCRDLLTMIRESSMPVTESIKWGQPHFDGRSAVLKWYCARGWTNVIFYRGHLLADVTGLFEPTDNVRMRTWRIAPDQAVVGTGFDRLLAQAVALDLREG